MGRSGALASGPHSGARASVRYAGQPRVPVQNGRSRATRRRYISRQASQSGVTAPPRSIALRDRVALARSASGPPGTPATNPARLEIAPAKSGSDCWTTPLSSRGRIGGYELPKTNIAGRVGCGARFGVGLAPYSRLHATGHTIMLLSE